MFTVFWVLKTLYHELIFFWQAAMFSYTSIIWRDMRPSTSLSVGEMHTEQVSAREGRKRQR